MAQRELAKSARNRRFSQVQAVRDRALATCEAAVERLNWENHGILTYFDRIPGGCYRVIDDGYPLGIVYVAGWEIPKIDWNDWRFIAGKIIDFIAEDFPIFHCHVWLPDYHISDDY